MGKQQSQLRHSLRAKGTQGVGSERRIYHWPRGASDTLWRLVILLLVAIQIKRVSLATAGGEYLVSAASAFMETP